MDELRDERGRKMKITGITAKGRLVVRLWDLGLSVEDAFAVADELAPVFKVFEQTQGKGDQRQAVFDTFDALTCSLKLQSGEMNGLEFQKALPLGTPLAWTFLVNLTGQLLELYCRENEVSPEEYLEEQRQNYYQQFDERDGKASE